MRLFIALPVKGAARDAIAAYQAELSRAGVRGSFLRPENLNLTLAFMGEQPGLGEAAAALSSFFAPPAVFFLDGLESFRGGEMLWLVPTEDLALRRLRGAMKLLHRELRISGISLEERKLQPHVTLCLHAVLPEGLTPAALPPPPSIPLEMEEVILYESHSPGGILTYSPKGSVVLAY